MRKFVPTSLPVVSKSALCSRLALAVAAALLIASPAAAEEKVPSPITQEVLIKASLMTLNDANVTGNYSVLHAKLAKSLREEVTPDKLKQVFKSFTDQKIDFDIVAAKAPVATKDAVVDARGALVLRGYFEVAASRVTYELDFVPSEGEWKPIKLNVDVKPVAKN